MTPVREMHSGREISSGFFTQRRKADVLFPENGELPIFTTFDNIPMSLLLHEQAIIDVESRHKTTLYQISAQSKNLPEFNSRYAELLLRAQCLELSERSLNGIKVGFLQLLDSTGEKIHTISEDPQHPDHGWQHVYRMSRDIHERILTFPELHHQGYREMLIATLFAEFHDKGQVSALLWNRENIGDQIKIKAGHAEEDGMLVELLIPEIQKYGSMTEEMATEVAELTSILIFLHDIPEKMIERLNGSEKANWKDGVKIHSLPEELLLKYYDNGTLNMFTTSRSQRLKILKHSKGKSNVLDKGDRKWGMHPEYEVAFADRLQAYGEDTTPMFLEVPESIMLCMKDIAIVTRNADVKDMMYTDKAHPRKFHVDKSKTRNVFEADSGAFLRITEGLGDDTKSDFERAMWEIMAYIKLNIGNSLWNDPYEKERLVQTVKKSFLETQKFFKGLLSGENGTHVLHDTVSERVATVGLKCVKNAEASEQLINELLRILNYTNDFGEVTTAIKNVFDRITPSENSNEYYRRYEKRTAEILFEIEHSIRMLRVKPNNDDGKIHTYSDADIRFYEELCSHLDTYLQVLIASNSLADEEKVSLSMIDGSFDSIGSIADMKTLIPLSGSEKEMLERLDRINL